MKRIKYAIIPLCGFALIAGLAIFASAASKPTIAVMDFKNKTNRGGWELGSGAADMMTTQLVKTRKFTVVERDKLKTIMKEQNIGATGLVDTKAAEIGKLLGAQYIVIGAVTEYGSSHSSGSGAGISVAKTIYRTGVDIRIVNASTGEVIFAENGNGEESASSGSFLGIGGGDSGAFDEKKGQESMRKAIIDVCEKIKKEEIKD